MLFTIVLLAAALIKTIMWYNYASEVYDYEKTLAYITDDSSHTIIALIVLIAIGIAIILPGINLILQKNRSLSKLKSRCISHIAIGICIYLVLYSISREAAYEIFNDSLEIGAIESIYLVAHYSMLKEILIKLIPVSIISNIIVFILAKIGYVNSSED